MYNIIVLDLCEWEVTTVEWRLPEGPLSIWFPVLVLVTEFY